MKFITRLLLLTLLLIPAPSTKADETPAPGEQPKTPATDAPRKDVAGAPVALKIRAAKGLGETSLQIPRKVIKIVDPHDAGPGVQSRGISPLQTIVAGLALSAALGLGGLQLARRRSRSGLIVIAILAIGGGALAASQVFADRAPANPKPAAKEETNAHGVGMPATIQILENGEAVELSIDLDRAKELLADLSKK